MTSLICGILKKMIKMNLLTDRLTDLEKTSGYQRGNVGERDKLGDKSWTIKKAEHQRIEATELWCWRRLLRVPSTARR